MRDEKEERKKQVRSNKEASKVKQTNKAKQQYMYMHVVARAPLKGIITLHKELYCIFTQDIHVYSTKAGLLEHQIRSYILEHSCGASINMYHIWYQQYMYMYICISYVAALLTVLLGLYSLPLTCQTSFLAVME